MAEIDHLFGAIYDELRMLARRQVARLPPGQTLSPTALVHEAYMKLADASGGSLRDELHFRALAARAMRQVIIDSLRRRHAYKRDPGLPTHDLKQNPDPSVWCKALDLRDDLREGTTRDPNPVAGLQQLGGQ